MKMFKDGHEAYVEKTQVELMKASGWTKEKPEVVVEVVVEVEKEVVVEVEKEEAHVKPVAKLISKKKA